MNFREHLVSKYSGDLPHIQVSYHPQKSSTGRVKSGGIYLRISSFASKKTQQEHIEHLTDKLIVQWKKRLDSGRVEPMKAYLNKLIKEKSVNINVNPGFSYCLQLKFGLTKSVKIERIGTTIYVAVPETFDGKIQILEAKLWKWLCKTHHSYVFNYLKKLSKYWLELEESPRKLTLKSVKSRWGSCQHETKTIMLARSLLLLPPRVFEYVCIHELAHIRHPNHSDIYWNFVAKKMPDWKTQRKRLRSFEHYT